MHELSVCQDLVGQLMDLGRRHRAVAIERVVLRIGPLSGVEPALLEAAYPVAAAGTVAEGAELVIEPAPIQVRCPDCGAVTEAAPNRLVCGACGNWRTQVVSGDELLLASVELSTTADEPDALAAAP